MSLRNPVSLASFDRHRLIHVAVQVFITRLINVVVPPLAFLIGIPVMVLIFKIIKLGKVVAQGS
jgi:hypothetical protein